MRKIICVVVLIMVASIGFGENPPRLDKEYSNKFFALRYPSTWQIVQEENRMTAKTTISLQIMEIQKNDVDFMPNINIILADKKWVESTEYIAQQVSGQYKRLFPGFKKIGIVDTEIGGYKGSVLQYSAMVQGYFVRTDQYIVKKADNTTFIITAACDGNKYQSQMVLIKAILNTIVIK